MAKQAPAPAPVAWKLPEFCSAAKVSQSKLRQFPPALRPESVYVGKARIIVEAPRAWLLRIGRSSSV